ncbi:MAG: hypothetical protein J0M24_07520 [Verrucomicrobia bacterium]|nr:hypothetical protein [Verrucomicrobiota bacterium]
MRDLTPEQQARQQIDAQLQACGTGVISICSLNRATTRQFSLQQINT